MFQSLKLDQYISLELRNISLTLSLHHNLYKRYSVHSIFIPIARTTYTPPLHGMHIQNYTIYIVHSNGGFADLVVTIQPFGSLIKYMCMYMLLSECSIFALSIIYNIILCMFITMPLYRNEIINNIIIYAVYMLVAHTSIINYTYQSLKL